MAGSPVRTAASCGAMAELTCEARAFRMRQLGEGAADGIDPRRGLDWDQVGVREVAVIMSVFLAAHVGAFPAFIIPFPCLLTLGDPAIQFPALALDLELDRAAHGGDRIDVFEFDFGAERRARLAPDRNIHIASHLSFLHVGIGDPGEHKDLPQAAEERRRLVCAFEGRLGHDFHQRCARAVEVEAARLPEMRALPRILFEVDARQWDRPHHTVRPGPQRRPPVLREVGIIKRDAPADDQRQIVLTDLVVLRHVRRRNSSFGPTC